MSITTKKSVRVSVDNTAQPGRFELSASIGNISIVKEVLIPPPHNATWAFVSMCMPAYVHNPQPPTPRQ